jgi:hypothetical protein
MKVVTIGMSPFLLTAKARLNRLVISFLKQSGHDTASFVWGHDPNYHVPDEDERFYYKLHDGTRVELYPFRLREAATSVYDLIKETNPDLIITVGDLREFAFMGAVKSFMDSESLRWLWVFSPTITRLNDDGADLIAKSDAILCTSESAKALISHSYQKPLLDACIVGNFNPTFSFVEQDKSFDCMMNCKRMSQDNLAMGMEICAKEGLRLYAHTNVHEQIGDYDPVSLADLFDPESEHIVLPETYVSTVDGVSDQELAHKYRSSEIFLSLPVVSATALTVFEAMSCGCYPLMTECAMSKEIAVLLEQFLGEGLIREEFLIESIPLMIPGESYIQIPDPRDLRRKLKNARKKIVRDKGLGARFAEFSGRYDGKDFLTKLGQMLEQVAKAAPTLCLETL